MHHYRSTFDKIKINLTCGESPTSRDRVVLLIAEGDQSKVLAKAGASCKYVVEHGINKGSVCKPLQ